METLQPSVGTTLKILVHFEVEGKTMDDCDFMCEFYGRNQKSVVKTKEEHLRIDEQKYVAIIDTREVGTGSIMCKLSVGVPDADCPNGIRKEVVRVPANVNVLE